MLDAIFNFLAQIDAFFWGKVGFVLIALLGCYFSIRTRLFQIRVLPSVFRTFVKFLKEKKQSDLGTHPIRVFFTSVGGMIGVGNIVGIITALQLGGPGAIFWVWVAAFLGSILKYSEVFLGLKYRVPNGQGGYDGGSIHFLRKAFNMRWVATLSSVLLCIYGAEIYQFSTLAHSISINWHVDHLAVVLGLLGLIFYTVIGGIRRVSRICSLLMPLFTVAYLLMCFYVIGHHLSELPLLLQEVVQSAFTGHAAVGGFAGASVILAIQHGVARSVYAADVGIGFDSIVHSETRATQIGRQACLAILGVFTDNIICSSSLLVAFSTGLWKMTPQLDPSLVVQTALGLYFPGQEFFMPLFLFVLVYTTLISYLFVGLKCARQLSVRQGERVYLMFAALFLFFFSFFDASKALLVMSLSGCALLIINLLGIFRLRKEIEFIIPEEERVEQIITGE